MRPDSGRWVRCPGCRELKEWLPADGGGEWYVLRRHSATSEEGTVVDEVVLTRSPYCRSCTGNRNTAVRRSRKLLRRVETAVGSLDTPGPSEALCDVCGAPVGQLEVVSAAPTVFACQPCAALLKMDRSQLVAALRELLANRHRRQEGRGRRAPLVDEAHVEVRLRSVIIWMGKERSVATTTQGGG